MTKKSVNEKSDILSRNLHDAKLSKKDEFYTQLTDIEKEIRHYRKHFKNKVVLCDDYGEASFIKEVKNAIDDFSNKNNIKINTIENRFAELIF